MEDMPHKAIETKKQTWSQSQGREERKGGQESLNF